MFALAILLGVVVASSALPVQHGWGPSYGVGMSAGEFGPSIQNEIDTEITAESSTKGLSEQSIVFGGFQDLDFNWNGIQNTDDAALPKFSDDDFDWQQYLETAEQGGTGQNLNQIAEDAAVQEMKNNGLLPDDGSFDMQKYMEDINKEMEELGLNE